MACINYLIETFIWSSGKWEPGEKSLIKTLEFDKRLLLHGDKTLFLSYLMNVSGQIMLNATYMHNQMTYLWQGLQITLCKCTFIILQFRLLKGEQNLGDPKVQQVHLGVTPGVFPLGFGDRVFGVWWEAEQLEGSSWSHPGWALLPVYWKVDCRQGKFNYFRGIPVPVLLWTFTAFPKRGQQTGIQPGSTPHLISSFHPQCTPHSLALWVCCECWICSAKTSAMKIF